MIAMGLVPLMTPLALMLFVPAPLLANSAGNYGIILNRLIASI